MVTRSTVQAPAKPAALKKIPARAQRGAAATQKTRAALNANADSGIKVAANPAAPPVAAQPANPTKPTKTAGAGKPADTAKKAKAVKEAEAARAAKTPKPTKPAKSPKADKTEKAAKPAKPARKEKLIRDSFTMPESDFKLIASVKQRALAFQHAVKKSEVLRAGLMALQGLSEAQLRALLENLPVIKTGRPKKAG